MRIYCKRKLTKNRQYDKLMIISICLHCTSIFNQKKGKNMNKNRITLLFLLASSWALFAVAVCVWDGIIRNELPLPLFWPWLLGFPLGIGGTAYCIYESND